MASQGGMRAETAKLTRSDESNPGGIFQLDVRFAD